MRRWWPALGLLGLAIAVVVPVTWWAGRPAASVGTLAVGAGSAAPGGSPTGSPAGAVPAVPPTVAAVLPSSSRPARTAVNARAGRARLAVPSLGIDAPIVAVGVRSDGSMAIPSQVSDVGWYQFGPAPGSSTGSAVLAGHVDSAKQGQGALFDLGRVAVGARVEVTLSSGRTIGYRVTGRRLFVKQKLPTEQLFARTGAPRLVVITCGGPFIRKLSSYRDNLVVAAEPQPPG